MNKAELKDKIGKLEAEVSNNEKTIFKLKENNKESGVLLDELRKELIVVAKKEEFQAKQDAITKERESWTQEQHDENEAFMERLRERNQEDVIEGFLDGWWDLDEDGNMAAFPQVFKISDFPTNPLMAHVMAAAGIFPSVGQAKKNGWDKSIETGLFIVTKKKIRIRVEE